MRHSKGIWFPIDQAATKVYSSVIADAAEPQTPVQHHEIDKEAVRETRPSRISSRKGADLYMDKEMLLLEAVTEAEPTSDQKSPQTKASKNVKKLVDKTTVRQ